jgi:arsenite methyltransferase
MVPPMKELPQPLSDVWSEWLLHHRLGDDPAFAERVHAGVNRIADRVIDAAQLAPGMTLADIGTGEGLIAFRAIERVGPKLNVVLTDVSAPMIRHAASLAHQRRVHGQCTFMLCGADKLEGIADASVDVITTRAVLAYVADKNAAVREFRRILKPGGRISLAEPMLQDDALLAVALKARIDAEVGKTQDRFLPLLHRWKAAQYPDTMERIAQSPIANYSERNLFDIVRACGFLDIHLELHMDLLPSIIRSWDVFLRTSPHPWAPTPSVILAQQFTAEERELFERILRPIVEAPDAVTVSRIIYLSAMKPTI